MAIHDASDRRVHMTGASDSRYGKVTDNYLQDISFLQNATKEKNKDGKSNTMEHLKEP
jgi:hypothetical protein